MPFNHQAWRDKNRDKYRASQKRYRTRNRKKVTDATRRWANTPKGMRSCLNSAYKKRYGLTLAEYERLLKKQNSTCAICDRKDGDDHRRLFVDHCHKTGKIRGLLCYRCNTGLASFSDNVETVCKAFNYLAQAEGK